MCSKTPIKVALVKTIKTNIYIDVVGCLDAM